MITSACVHRYGDNVDTDTIIPGRYLTLRRPEELAGHCMEGLDPDFVRRVKAGDIIVAGRNFGSGSSREHAPIAIRAAGISCVVATSFARIFYRNAINIGLPVFECPELVVAVSSGDRVDVDLAAGAFQVGSTRFETLPLPAVIQSIVDAQGLVSYIAKEYKQRLAGEPKP
jgi:3-isopropylmalate/(R)-2-methylmalate dehydratase small subunit